MRYIFIFLIANLFTSLCYGQGNLKISFVEGAVSIISGNISVAAHKGSLVTKNSIVQLKDRSLCMVLDTNGRSVQLKAGSYTYENIFKMLASAKENHTLSGLFKYLKDNLVASNEPDGQGIVAGVYRGIALMKMPANYAILFDGNIVIEWSKPSAKGKVRLIIEDSISKVVDSVFNPSATPTNSFTISTQRLRTGIGYEWKAELTPTRQPLNWYHHFLIANKANEKEIREDLKILQNKGYDKKVIDELRKDIFTKWKDYYASRHASL